MKLHVIRVILRDWYHQSGLVSRDEWKTRAYTFDRVSQQDRTIVLLLNYNYNNDLLELQVTRVRTIERRLSEYSVIMYTGTGVERKVMNSIQPWISRLKFPLFFLRCILLITKVKFFQRTTSRNVIVVLKNDKRVLTATLCFWTRTCLF